MLSIWFKWATASLRRISADSCLLLSSLKAVHIRGQGFRQETTHHMLTGLYLGLTWNRIKVPALTECATLAAMEGVEWPNSTHFSLSLFSIVASWTGKKLCVKINGINHSPCLLSPNTSNVRTHVSSSLLSQVSPSIAKLLPGTGGPRYSSGSNTTPESRVTWNRIMNNNDEGEPRNQARHYTFCPALSFP